MGGSISIVNETKHNLAICLCQVGPLYYDNYVKPGDTFYRNTGAVHFSIRAWINEDGNVNPVTEMDCMKPFLYGFTAAAIILSYVVSALNTNLTAVPAASSGLGIIGTAFDTVDKTHLTSVADKFTELTKSTPSLYSPGWYTGYEHKLTIRGGFNEETKKLEPLCLYDEQGRKVA